jgi:hypothetical protein
VSAIDPSDHPNADPEDAARELATAEIAVRQAYTAVESTDKPVKIEIEILQKNATRALIESSRCAALLCVGSIGLKHSSQGRIGSTAAALATARIVHLLSSIGSIRTGHAKAGSSRN